MEARRLGNLYGEDKGTGYAGNVWDKNFIAPTLMTMQGGNREPMIIEEVKQIGSLSDKKTQSRTVYDTDAVSPTLCSGMDHGNTMPYICEQSIVAMRGRNPENPTSRTAGLHTEQRLEPNQEGICNTITTVQKDNMVMETVRIKQATEQGYAECKVGGVADFSYPSSKTRRGRVQEGGEVSPTLTVEGIGVCRVEKEEKIYRIRKLTPRECGRLMSVSDSDITKMESVNSNTQLYKQFGNSIVVDVMVAMFSNLNIQGLPRWEERQ